jgi:hypothetical protein
MEDRQAGRQTGNLLSLPISFKGKQAKTKMLHLSVHVIDAKNYSILQIRIHGHFPKISCT